MSGFGDGVGPYVVNGILVQLEKDGTQILDDRIVLRPFPIAIADATERRRRWKAYRQDMLAQAGVAVFLSATKRRFGQHRRGRWNGGRIYTRLAEAPSARAGWMYRAYSLGASHAGSGQLCRLLYCERI